MDHCQKIVYIEKKIKWNEIISNNVYQNLFPAGCGITYFWHITTNCSDIVLSFFQQINKKKKISAITIQELGCAQRWPPLPCSLTSMACEGDNTWQQRAHRTALSHPASILKTLQSGKYVISESIFVTCCWNILFTCLCITRVCYRGACV